MGRARRGAESIDVFQQRLKAYAAKNTKQRVRALLCWWRIQRAHVYMHVRMGMYCLCAVHVRGTVDHRQRLGAGCDGPISRPIRYW